MSASSVGIAVLLPDLLDTYSDAGNAIVLERRLAWRGVAAEVVTVTARDEPPLGCDVYLLGGGEDTAQRAAARWLERRPALTTTLAERAVTLAVCAGLQLLGRSSAGPEGLQRPGLGLLDLTTRPGAARVVGDAVGLAELPGVGRLVGFHNHRGVSTLGRGARPLARVEHGPGNRPGDTAEGALTGDADGPGIVATYLHGPVLARNPALADHLLARVLGHPLPALDPDRLPEVEALRRDRLAAPAARGRRSPHRTHTHRL